jgi:hypothetical protein
MVSFMEAVGLAIGDRGLPTGMEAGFGDGSDG